MINVLPHEYKLSLHKEFYARVIVTGLVLLCLAGIIFTVLLAPSYILVSAKARVADEHLATLNQLAVGGGSLSINNTVTKINAALKFFDTSDAGVTPSGLIQFVLSSIPTGITVDQIHIVKFDKTYQVVMSGFANNRDTLVGFQDVLKNDPRVDSVVLPLSSFIANQNLQFNVTLTTKPI